MPTSRFRDDQRRLMLIWSGRDGWRQSVGEIWEGGEGEGIPGVVVVVAGVAVAVATIVTSPPITVVEGEVVVVGIVGSLSQCMVLAVGEGGVTER